MSKVVVITLMRKGSKRFPNKVMFPLFGIPLYMYTVEFARQINFPYYLAHDYDNLYFPDFVNEIKREKKYTGDEHKTNKEIKSFKLDADIYILLQATSPFRVDPKIIEMSVDRLTKSKHLKAIIGGRRLKDSYYVSRFNPVNYDVTKRTDNGCKRNILFRETGNFYIFKKEQLEKKHILDCKQKEIDIQYDTYNIDIDTIEDIQKIERAIYEL